MLRRSVAATALAVVLLGAAVGCTGSPEPVDTTPAALTEEEAFAAAEETYRAYVDALNRVDLADPETFEAVYALTTGDANAGLREEFSIGHAEGFAVAGKSVATVVEAVELRRDSVRLAVCLDVSEVDVTNAAGESQVDPDRVNVQSVLVTLISDAARPFQISSFDGRDGEPECDP